MAEKTLPEQARFLAKFVEENEYDEWPWADYEIAQMLEDLAAEIERLQEDRNELIEMLKETLKYGISDSRRKAAYDLVVRLGGYQGRTVASNDIGEKSWADLGD